MSVVGAGSVVTHSVDKKTVVIGSPAKFLKKWMNKILKFFIGMGHPAHFHLFKNVISQYEDQCIVVVSEKDITDLLKENQINYMCFKLW